MRAWLRDIRTARGLSQAEFARRLGITEGAYSLIETGRRQKKMDVEFVVKVAEAAEMDVRALVETIMREEFERR